MSRTGICAIGLLLVFFAGLLDTVEARQQEEHDSNDLDSSIRRLIGDDDGSFILAGYPAAVVNIGSFPYGDPNYHAEGDIPETCDVENAAMTVRATLAAVTTIDRGL